MSVWHGLPLLALLGVSGAFASQVPAVPFSAFLQRSRASHWAFKSVEKPTTPEVSRPDWIETPVDAFVLSRLDQAGLTPSPPAERRTLIRRLSADLRGLPPTPQEVRAFVADTRPDAYECLIEQFLASGQYGERWGRHWLDVARYADTKGYVFEEERRFPYAYTYRDYVIRAFNEDLPYDRFIVEQLAADRLDLGEDPRPLAALGFLTLGRRFLNRTDDIIDDRIDVVSRGLLGLTVTCARCHDHKFDPIAASDYYALYGLFRSTHTPDTLPLISEPNSADPEHQAFLKILAEKEKDLQAYEREVHRDLLIETREKLGAYLIAAQEALDVEDETTFKTLAKERDIRHRVLRLWADFLEKQVETPDAIFKPLAWFRAVPSDTFAQQAPAILERIRGDESINARIRAAFDQASPISMREVMECYTTVLEKADSHWRTRLAALFEDEPGNTSGDDDEAAEALRQLAFGPQSPAHIRANMAYRISDTPQQQKVRAKRRARDLHEATHPGRPDRAMVLNDSDRLYDPYVFLRGKADNRGATVSRRFLQVLSEGEPKTFTDGSGRLDLAQAIVDPNNPLTARVFVNRVWFHHFGRPLVDTPSDFGLQSDPPTHPELLDFLAATFVERNWSVKALHRMIVRSNTYRQRSDTHARGRAQDIENRLIWRQNRRRLDFESMRDALLAASGELDLTQGGPGESLTEAPVTKRRTVYGLVERQNMAGFIKTFDFASPDTHSPKRYHTIVPQQALFLMNSPFVLSRARALARRACDEAEGMETRVARLYDLCYQRRPQADELAQVTAFLSRRDFDSGPSAEPVAWQYGYGHVDPQTDRTTSFAPLEVFRKGRWQPRQAFPHDELGHISIHKGGGHPGRDPHHATIHRWLAPRAGQVSVSGRLTHPADEGDGVIGTIVSSRSGRLAAHAVFNGSQAFKLANIAVQADDTIDLVVSPGPSDSYDGYQVSLEITMDLPPLAPTQGARSRWEAETDFAGPRAVAPAPLSSWGQFAQVLLLSNEFMYID